MKILLSLVIGTGIYYTLFHTRIGRNFINFVIEILNSF